MTDKLPWAEINRRLIDLKTEAIILKAEFPDEADFSPRFADLADAIREVAHIDHLEDLSVRLTDILVDIGVVPEHERQH